MGVLLNFLYPQKKFKMAEEQNGIGPDTFNVDENPAVVEILQQIGQ